MTMRVNLAIMCSFPPRVLACSGLCNQTYAEDMPCYTDLYRIEYLRCFYNYAGNFKNKFCQVCSFAACSHVAGRRGASQTAGPGLWSPPLAPEPGQVQAFGDQQRRAYSNRAWQAVPRRQDFEARRRQLGDDLDRTLP